MAFRVIQYATGTTGRLTLKTLAERPDMGKLIPGFIRNRGEASNTTPTTAANM